MDIILLKATAVLYLLATASFVFYVLVRNTAARLPTLVLLVGFLLHTSALSVHFLQEAYPAVTQFHEALTFKSWLIVALYLVIQIKYRLTVLGAIVTPVVFLMTLAAFAFGAQTFDEHLGNFGAREFGRQRFAGRWL